jgi:hypothetical protein
LAGKNFVRNLVQVIAKIKPVGSMACGTDSFSQNLYGDFNSANMVLAASIRVRFFLSVTPFCYGV